MSFRIRFLVGAFGDRSELEMSHEYLQAMLDCLCACDVAYLKAHPETPGIYQSGVRYKREPVNQEDWKDIPVCIRDREADCEDLACWRAAELQVKQGIAARPIFRHKVMPNGSYLYHIVVRYPDGTIEDPSKKLGMGANLFG